MPADKSGDAQITWAPPSGASNHDLNVYGTTEDGLTLPSTDYCFSVN